jgi:hypothetical protein
MNREDAMKLKPNRAWSILTAAIVCLILLASTATATVVKEEDKTYLVDQTGERWDISQAVSIGYDPFGFEFGIGRYAFQPLDDRHWDHRIENAPPAMRIIGVAGNEQSHAYSIEKLRYHETANTFLGSQPIVAGY